MALSERPSLLKQLLGAAIGATLALLLYGIYHAVAPRLTAVLRVPHTYSSERARLSETDLGDDNRALERREQRNQEIAEHFAAPVEPIAPEVIERIRQRVEEFEQTVTPEEEARINAELEGGTIPPPEPVFQPQSPPEPTPMPVVPIEAQVQWEEPEHDVYVGSDELPGSGIGAGAGVFVALIATAITRRRRLVAMLGMCS
ncbi:hypothetical protein COU80_01155 [Candidatus Peregrinibacteria bacterium CG10_big_fil_rev_8_21_14_0_10_55_24]|nr:MAG: hypothetical protein COU80_01155 [Candidatus Peregrinibacteria bacterium CG10_big_fil_rev_8_21_14_0_10_55_24]